MYNLFSADSQSVGRGARAPAAALRPGLMEGGGRACFAARGSV
eukprot:COSAG01_NODE_9705_length_2365_cov_4.193292_4_plen_43_part_00